MKAEPASRILIEDPALADRVSHTRANYPANSGASSSGEIKNKEQKKPISEQKR
jgi:hypothetical protein